MLNNFSAWVESIVFEDRTFVEVIFSPKCDNPSVRLVIDIVELVAEIVVWESGDYFAEVIDAAGQQTHFQETGVLVNSCDFNKIFAPFFSAIATLRNGTDIRRTAQGLP